MCGLGLPWEFQSNRAIDALDCKGDFLAPLRRHDGWDVDWRAAAAIYVELVANVVEHVPGPIRVTVTCFNDECLLRVEDIGRFFEMKPALPQDSQAESGRGLFIVAHFAEELHSEQLTTGGKAIVARLPRVTLG
jgi:anti-sigma regulatory factor (Ser/Thr protein kinase)